MPACAAQKVHICVINELRNVYAMVNIREATAVCVKMDTACYLMAPAPKKPIAFRMVAERTVQVMVFAPRKVKQRSVLAIRVSQTMAWNYVANVLTRFSHTHKPVTRDATGSWNHLTTTARTCHTKCHTVFTKMKTMKVKTAVLNGKIGITSNHSMYNTRRTQRQRVKPSRARSQSTNFSSDHPQCSNCT